ncbi:DUF3592 domain-containing protein [Hymenobacter koreensis]|uniref:DUF3592 domain-containing protein n=1 Tax=Hymenobacter koreensis TaxID=1084523 RepID=A0ABP8J1F9_9BACT
MSLTFHAEAVIFLLMGVFFTMAAVYSKRSQQARQQRGLKALATIIALKPSRQLFSPQVRFTTADGRTIEAETESAAEAGQYEVGQQVEVIYDLKNPENVDLAGVKPSGSGFMLLVGLLFTAIGVLQILDIVPVFEEYWH